jgi:adenylate cyclase class 2
MQTEIEAKFTNIDKEKIREKLKSVGAVLIAEERLMRRRNFDNPYLEKKRAWVRVRDEGDKIVLSYKELQSQTLHGMKELLIEVNDFDKMSELLNSIGITAKNYQETFRESWILGKAQIDIDTWPWIRPFIEIEGESEEAVKGAAKLLDLDWNTAKFGTPLVCFQEVFDIHHEFHNWPLITFDVEPPAEWKRK